MFLFSIAILIESEFIVPNNHIMVCSVIWADNGPVFGETTAISLVDKNMVYLALEFSIRSYPNMSSLLSLYTICTPDGESFVFVIIHQQLSFCVSSSKSKISNKRLFWLISNRSIEVSHCNHNIVSSSSKLQNHIFNLGYLGY